VTVLLECPLWVDDVEKVGCVRQRRNNRIRMNSVLIPYCVLDPVFESMSLADPPQNRFST
jgi:hypothetical protein